MAPRAYLAPSLDGLRAEIDARWPGRDTASDGWIGDARHAATKSEHNPDEKGCVHALDIDKDGIDPKALLRELIGDPRVWYVIWDRTIWSRTHGWAARAYKGVDPHTGHLHVSILLTEAAETDTAPWLPDTPAARPTPAPAVSYGPNTTIRTGSRTVQLGSRGTDVARLQTELGIKADGYFGPDTHAAVVAFQRARGWAANGVVGTATWRAVLAPPTVSLRAVIAAQRADPGRKQGGTTPGAADDVRLVEAALAKLGLLPWKFARDGSAGTLTRQAIAAFQRRQGWTGKNADGLVGPETLRRLGKVGGFTAGD